jgi:Ca2+/Na+ antiporter
MAVLKKSIFLTI